MGLGAVLEPSIVIFLLFGGTWINRAHPHTNYASNHTSGNWRDAGEDGEFTSSRRGPVLESDSETENEIQISGKLNGLKQQAHECATADSSDSGDDSSALDAFDPDNDIERALSSSLLPHQEPTWRTREVSVFGWKKKMVTPNTARFRNHLLSRLLAKFPFLVEAWYWALVYWVCYLLKIQLLFDSLRSTTNCVQWRH